MGSRAACPNNLLVFFFLFHSQTPHPILKTLLSLPTTRWWSGLVSLSTSTLPFFLFLLLLLLLVFTAAWLWWKNRMMAMRMRWYEKMMTMIIFTRSSFTSFLTVFSFHKMIVTMMSERFAKLKRLPLLLPQTLAERLEDDAKRVKSQPQLFFL